MESFFLWLADKLGAKEAVIKLISNINFEQVSKVFIALSKLASITLVSILAGAGGGYLLNHYLIITNRMVNNHYCHRDIALENSIYPNLITLEKNAYIKNKLKKWKNDTPEIHSIISYFGHNQASDSFKLVGNTMWTKTKDGIKFPSSREIAVLNLSINKGLSANCINMQEWMLHERTKRQIDGKEIECKNYPAKSLGICPVLVLMSDPLMDLEEKPLVEITKDTVIYICSIPHSGSKNSFIFYFTESPTNYLDTVIDQTKWVSKHVVN